MRTTAQVRRVDRMKSIISLLGLSSLGLLITDQSIFCATAPKQALDLKAIEQKIRDYVATFQDPLQKVEVLIGLLARREFEYQSIEEKLKTTQKRPKQDGLPPKQPRPFLAANQLQIGKNFGKIRFTVQKMAPPHPFQNEKGHGTLYSFTLFDGTEYFGLVTFESGVANKFKLFKTYTLEDPFVKFNKFENRKQINCNAQTVVTEDGVGAVSEDRSSSPRIVDVIRQSGTKILGICVSVAPRENNTDEASKNGTQESRVMQLCDETGIIDVTIQTEPAVPINKGDVVTIKNFAIREKPGGQFIEITPASLVKINEKSQRTDELRKWYQDGRNVKMVKNLSGNRDAVNEISIPDDQTVPQRAQDRQKIEAELEF